MPWITIKPYLLAHHHYIYMFKDIIIVYLQQQRQRLIEMNDNTKKEEWLQNIRNIFSDIKSYYIQFLGSLKYQNLSQRKKIKTRLRRGQESINGDQGWELNMNKTFNFEQELAAQNNGSIAFRNLLESIKRLQKINHEIGMEVMMNEQNQTNTKKLKLTLEYFEYMNKHISEINSLKAK